MSYNDFLYDLIYNLWSTLHRIHSNRFHYNPFIYLFIGETPLSDGALCVLLTAWTWTCLNSSLEIRGECCVILLINDYSVFIEIDFYRHFRFFFLWFRLNKIMLFYWIIFACFNSCHLTAKTVTTKLWSRDCMCNRLKNALETHHKSNHFSMKTSRNQTKNKQQK